MTSTFRRSLMCLLIFPLHVSAWGVSPRSDAEIANNAQIVVIARVKPNSLENLRHYGSFETKAVLVVSRVLKGKLSTKELPIMIGYDAIPVPQHVINPNFGTDGD